MGNRPTFDVLNEFYKLPESERKAGAIKIANLAASERVIVSPPEEALVLKVHARFLAREKDGSLRHAEGSDFPLMRGDPKVLKRWGLFLQPNTEMMWITGKEWRSLLPEAPKIGQRIEVDSAIPMRMARFHLNPKRATTSEGGIVREKEVKVAEMILVVESVSNEMIVTRVEGRVHWGSEFDESKATSPNGDLKLGYETALVGKVVFDRETKTVTRFDVVAPGDIWGRWGDANNKSIDVERAGRKPFGFAFELANGESPTERIPPGGNGRYVEGTGYFRD